MLNEKIYNVEGWSN